MSPSVVGATPGKQEGGGRGGAARSQLKSIGFAALCWRVCVLLCLLGAILLTILAIFVMPSQQRALCLCWCDDVVLVVVLPEGLDWIVFPGDHVTPRTPL